jgi:molybdopterin biosynthesis enzyme
MTGRRGEHGAAAAVLEPEGWRPFPRAQVRSRRPVAEHQAYVRAIVPAQPPLLSPLHAAEGRVLAADVTAICPLPAFDNSAVDGYAVASADVATAGPQSPAVLPVRADIPAGCGDGGPLDRRMAHRIMTGAPVPSGADAVIPVESTDGGLRKVSVTASVAPGANIRRRGEDIRPGATALEAGTVLGPAQLGPLSALGQEHVLVRPALRVLLISTGSELTAQGTVPGAGQVRNANSIMLGPAGRHLTARHAGQQAKISACAAALRSNPGLAGRRHARPMLSSRRSRVGPLICSPARRAASTCTLVSSSAQAAGK